MQGSIFKGTAAGHHFSHPFNITFLQLIKIVLLCNRRIYKHMDVQIFNVVFQLRGHKASSMIITLQELDGLK